MLKLPLRDNNYEVESFPLTLILDSQSYDLISPNCIKDHNFFKFQNLFRLVEKNYVDFNMNRNCISIFVSFKYLK